MNIAEQVEKGACEYPHRVALVFEGRPISYRECADAASRIAGLFSSAGVRAGDRVALFLPNIPDFVTAYLGTLKLGAIAVSINATLKREEATFILRDCGASVAVTTRESLDQISMDSVRFFCVGPDFEATLDAVEPVLATESMEAEAPAVVVYTSGTTGQPKGATLSHSNVVRNVEAKRRHLRITSRDRGLLFMPLYHCFGQNAVLNALLHAGATVVLHRRFDLDRVLESIAQDEVTMFFGVPATYALLIDRVSRAEMTGVRLYFSAAAPLPLELEERWAGKFGKPIFQGYGLTETSPFASYNHRDHYHPGSIGTPIEGVEMKIVDPETGNEMAPGQKGQIVVRGHNVMLGYWNKPAETALAIRDGWFQTGDVGHIDKEGYFFIEDRLSDTINSGGVKVYPAEVENVLAAHPAIAEAAVYGVPEPVLGEQVRADIVLKPGKRVSAVEIRSFCRQRLSAVKVPSVVKFTPEIPRSPTGKLLKRILRERASHGDGPRPEGNYSPNKDEIQRWIQDWLLVNLDSVPDFESSMAFADLGVDSILSVRLAQELGEWLGCSVEPTAAWNFPSPESMAEYLARRCTGRLDTESADITELSEENAQDLLLAELKQINR